MPSEWRDVLLGELATDVTVGYVGPMAADYVPDGIPFLRSQNVEPHRINGADIKFITQEFHSRLKKSALSPGDVVIVRTGRPGACAVIPETLPAANCSDLVIVRCGDNLDPLFLAYYVNSLGAHHVDSYLVGAVQQHFNVESARKLRVRAPGLAGQRAIARILGALDDKIELNRKMNDTLEQMARAIFKSWFVDFEPFRDKGMADSPLGRIPKGWKAGSLSDLVALIGGGTPRTSEPSYWNGDIPWYSVEDAPRDSDVFVVDTERSITQRGLAESSTRLLPRFTTIISARGTVGKCALAGVDMAMNQSCYGINGADGRGSFYTYFLVRQAVGELQQKTHGAVFDTITRDTFKAIEVVAPPSAATGQFDAVVSPYLLRVLGNRRESRALAAIRDALLPKLMSGEVRVA